MTRTETHWLPESSKTRNAGDRVIKDAVVPLELKVDEAKNELIAYASVFDVLDRQGDIVVRGAFSRTIREDGDRIKVLYQHDTHRPIGIPLHLEEDSKGLLTVSKISDVADGRDALRLIKDGVIDRMSIGFEVRKATAFEDEDLRSRLTGYAAQLPMYKLEDIRLWEYSPVTFAANDSANIVAVRAAFGGWLPVVEKRWYAAPVTESLVEGSTPQKLDETPVVVKLDETCVETIDEKQLEAPSEPAASEETPEDVKENEPSVEVADEHTTKTANLAREFALIKQLRSFAR